MTRTSQRSACSRCTTPSTWKTSKASSQRSSKNCPHPPVIHSFTIANTRDKNTTTDSTEAIAENIKQAQDLVSFKSTEKELREEMRKWREFGQLINESYEQLKKKYIEQSAEEEKKKKMMAALEDEVKNLKELLRQSGVENRNLRETMEESSNSTIAELKRQNNKLREENIILRKEKEGLERLLTAKQQEQDILEDEKTVSNKLIQQLNDKIKVCL
eukprot:TRINITY_DN6439_c0_g3_i3.p1 TRINITY_DN6439_c0_g3~~TRINITY_DN6439_c0_g3_i3.p1  ORF type:complete len:216 (-),score=36.13 TRINITY_DN6439_c0_g3_i3:519-1166(-)